MRHTRASYEESVRRLQKDYLESMTTPNSATGDEPWITLDYKIGGIPVVMKVMVHLPPEEMRERFSWLAVIGWHYDGSRNNGMPEQAINEQMINLEHSIDALQDRDLCVQVYAKTGNGIKELVYYIEDREAFMKAFNEELTDQPRYPLQIEFFEDPEWGDLQTVHRLYLKRE